MFRALRSQPPALSAILTVASNRRRLRTSPVRFSLLLVNTAAVEVRGARVRGLAPAGFAVPDLFLGRAGSRASDPPRREASPARRPSFRAASAAFQLFPMLLDSKDPSGRLSAASVSAGPIVVRDSSMSEEPAASAARCSGSSEYLALPIVLALLAVGCSSGATTSGRRRATRTKRRRNGCATEADQKRAIIQETWNLMLPTSHRYAAEYYVPLVGVADRLKAAVDSSLLPGREDRRGGRRGAPRLPPSAARLSARDPADHGPDRRHISRGPSSRGRGRRPVRGRRSVPGSRRGSTALHWRPSCG